MPRIVAILIASVLTWFRSRLSMQMELIALRHQVAVYSRASLDRSCSRLIAGSGRGSRACGPAGNRLLRFRPTADRHCLAEDALQGLLETLRVRAASQVVRPLLKKSVTSSKICGAQIQCGARLGSSGNCISWDITRGQIHWRTHQSLAMDAPEPRAVQPPELGAIRKLPEVGGLHHHYERMTASWVVPEGLCFQLLRKSGQTSGFFQDLPMALAADGYRRASKSSGLRQCGAGSCVTAQSWLYRSGSNREGLARCVSTRNALTNAGFAGETGGRSRRFLDREQQ